MTESRTGAWEGSNGELLNRYRVSVWEDKKVLEMDGDDYYTTLWTYLISLNYTQKMVKTISFMHILPQW